MTTGHSEQPQMLNGAGPLPAPAALVRRYLLRLDAASRYTICVCMAVMVLLVSAQVFCRYLLAESIDWADEMSRLAFVWAVFLAIPHGLKHGVHVGIDVLTNKLSPRVQEGLSRLMMLVSGLLMVVVCYQAVLVAIDGWGELMPTIPVSASVFYIPVMLSCGHGLLHLLFMAWQGAHIWADKEEAA
ncbi:TRAP transporter small permease [Oceanimonas sp. CHS3-5]|uniref:TRAP transporter small permease n=1 Tax=Oceanimonas sp. CHS3-5 TaxID=3068186 RepID=UPI00273E82F4|nr:TRAP transporter small permease [Oceanimonas sp. CHS3-5]MDP5290978.1 TRAP transporter small permease [Oceanimonas sp. CHS3-5]